MTGPQLEPDGRPVTSSVYLIEDNEEWVRRFGEWWADSLVPEECRAAIGSIDRIRPSNCKTIAGKILSETRPIVLILDYELAPVGAGDRELIIQLIRDHSSSGESAFYTAAQSLKLADPHRQGLLYFAAALCNKNKPKVAVILTSVSWADLPGDGSRFDEIEPSINEFVRLAEADGRLMYQRHRPFKEFDASEFEPQFRNACAFANVDRSIPDLFAPLALQIATWVHPSKDEQHVQLFTLCRESIASFLSLNDPAKDIEALKVISGSRYPFADGLLGLFGKDGVPFNYASIALCGLAAHRLAWPSAAWKDVFDPAQASELGDARKLVVTDFSLDDAGPALHFVEGWRKMFARAVTEALLRLMAGSTDPLKRVVLTKDRVEFQFNSDPAYIGGLRRTLLERRHQLLALMRANADFADDAILPVETGDTQKLGHDRSYWLWEALLNSELGRLTRSAAIGDEPSRMFLRTSASNSIEFGFETTRSRP